MADRPVVPAPTEARIQRLLTGVQPPGAAPHPQQAWTVRPGPWQVPVPAVPRAVLVDVMGLTDLGRYEKTAWHIDFRYDDVPMLLAHRKMGTALSVAGHDPDHAQALASRFLKALGRAVAVYDKEVLLPDAAARLRAGNVTVANRHHQLRGNYVYFREAVGECLAGQGRWERDGTAANRLFAGETEAFINLQAAVQAWFSWLEHVLILALPFADYDPVNDDLAQIISDPWRGKYHRLFDVASDNAANTVYSNLVRLSERHRNTWAHGGFDKEQGLLHVHVPGVGAVPMNVSEHGGNVHFPSITGYGTDFDKIWSVLDHADAFLRVSHRTARGIQHAEAGLQVRFDEKSRQEQAAAAATDEDFDEFLNERSYAEDRAANMDW